MQLVGPLMTQRVIDVALPAHSASLVWRSALIFAGSLVIGFACQYGETILTALLGQRVMRDLRRDIFGHVQRLSITFFDRNPVGRLVTRVTSDVESLNELFTAGVVAGLGDLFTLLAISGLMLCDRLAAGARLVRRDSARLPRVARLSAQGARIVSRHPDTARAHQRVSPGADHRHSRRAGLRPRGDGGEALRRSESRPSDGESGFDHVLRALLPGDRGADVDRAGEPDRRRGASRRGRNADRRNRRRVPAAGAPVLPAAAGPVGQVQHAPAGDGRERARVPAARRA